MIDKNKYLYWIKDKKIADSELEETMQREMYSKIGLFIHFSQMIEYNVKSVICFYNICSEIEKIKNLTKENLQNIIEKQQIIYNDFERVTLGKLFWKFFELKIDLTVKQEAGDFIEIRNDLMHKLFKAEVFNHYLENISNLDEFCDDLNKWINLADKINKIMKEYFIKYQNQLNKYKKQLNY